MSKEVKLNVPTNLKDVKQLVKTHWPWMFIVIFLVGGFASGYYTRMKYFETANANIERQLQNKLTDAEKKMQAKDASINKLESIVESSSKLLKDALAQQSIQHQKEMRQLMKEYNLKIDSLTTAYAKLQGKDNEGTSSSGVIDGVRWFKWDDSQGRFHLYSPNIMKPYTEFTYNQRFKLDIVIFKQQAPDGALRTQTLHLYEIDDAGNVLNEAKVDVDKSIFKYAIEDTHTSMPAHHWLVDMTSEGELAVSYLPWNFHQNMIGLGFTGGATSKHQFVGITGMVFPPSWMNSSFGVGASVGYDPQNPGKATWRFQVAWSLRSIFNIK